MKNREIIKEGDKNFINLGKNKVEVLPTLPDGWGILKGATTAPVGFIWVWNKKSRLNGKEYRSALISEEVLKNENH